MNILLLGATGRTGKQVLEHALEQGYQVSCLVLNPERLIPQQHLSIFDGDPRNASDLQSAIKSCQAIISVLNISRTSDFPWSPLRTPKTFMSDTMSAVVDVAIENKLEKVILCSAWGVGDSRKDIPFWFRWTIDYSNIKYAYLDHERQEELLIQSKLNYTIVRPVGLTNFNQNLSVRESENNVPKPNLLISRKAVASYMVKCLSRSEKQSEIVVISND